MQPSTLNFSYGARIARKLGITRAIAFWSAMIFMPAMMQEWLSFLGQSMDANLLGGNMIEGMLMRVLRPYMRQNFTPDRRRVLLSDHYSMMIRHFVADPRLSAEPGLVVATLRGKNDAIYTLHVGGNTSKEGEMSFGLYDVDGHYLAKMAATVGRDDQDHPVLWIGGLQGAKPPMGRDEVVKATRDLFGLRPKGAVMLSAQAFAREMGLTALRAPGNEGHISQRGFRRLSRKRKIYADYGQFWEEIGGSKIGEGEYTIPVAPEVRDISEVKPHKRSEWKKRQALSEQLATDMLATLSGLRAA